jgi:hypothetical protein
MFAKIEQKNKSNLGNKIAHRSGIAFQSVMKERAAESR